MSDLRGKVSLFQYCQWFFQWVIDMSSWKPHVSRGRALHVTDAGTQSAPQSQRRIMSTQHMPTRCTVYTPDLEQSGQHNTLQAHPETEISLWATRLNTLMRQPDTVAHTGRGVGVTACYHNFILPLPAQPLTVMLTQTDAQTVHANMDNTQS